MTRAEHLAWCKARALEYADAGELTMAYTSMASDLRKHVDLENHAGIQLGFMMLTHGHLNTSQAMREFIEGFN